MIFLESISYPNPLLYPDSIIFVCQFEFNLYLCPYFFRANLLLAKFYVDKAKNEQAQVKMFLHKVLPIMHAHITCRHCHLATSYFLAASFTSAPKCLLAKTDKKVDKNENFPKSRPNLTPL